MKPFVYLLALLIRSMVVAEPSDVDMVALVSKVNAATVRVDSGADLSSGVIVSSDGYVLTVAHGLAPDKTQVTVRFCDGQTATAKVIVQHPASDVALLKIVDAGQQTFDAIPLAAQDVIHGTVVLAFGHPARDRKTVQAIVRLGNVVGTHANSIRSTCVLTAGDSGGPLVTADGRLVGINQRIGVSRTTNLHLNISACCAALKDTFDLRQRSYVEPNAAAVLRPLPVLKTSDWQRRAVEILDVQQQVLAWGTVINSRTVVTKLSLLTPNTALQVRKFDGVAQRCELIAQNLTNDVAVLRLSTAIDVPSIRADDAADVAVGSLVYGTSAGTPGIVSRIDAAEPAVRGRLGCTLTVAGDALFVEQVSADSAASDAGLQPGDELLQLGPHKTTQLADVGDVLEALQPGDWLSFHIRRAGVEHASFGQLRHSPAELLQRTEFLDGRSGELSRRRSSFAATLQHDLPVTAAQMGGPVLTADGRVVGINIARRAREAVLAVPIAGVLATCEEVDQ